MAAWSLAFVALAVFGTASDARAATPAEDFVQSGIEKSYAILNDSALSVPERQRQFHDFLSSIVDVKRVALFTLGPYARNATPADLDKFEPSFLDFLTVVYQRGLKNYTDPKITGSMERTHDDVIVNITAATSNAKAPPAQLAFRVRRGSNGGYVVTDMQVEGAWLALLQRSEFTAYLQQHDSNLGELATELDKRTARLRLAQNDGKSAQ